MRQDGAIEGTLPAKHEGGWRNKGSKIKQNQQENGEVAAHNNNKRRNYPPCKHCNKLGHTLFKCWKRPDAKCATSAINLGMKQSFVDTKVSNKM